MLALLASRHSGRFAFLRGIGLFTSIVEYPAGMKPSDKHLEDPRRDISELDLPAAGLDEVTHKGFGEVI